MLTRDLTVLRTRLEAMSMSNKEHVSTATLIDQVICGKLRYFSIQCIMRGLVIMTFDLLS